MARLNSPNSERGFGVDLVVADVFMPGLTGLKVLERLRSTDPYTPYIIITAFASDEAHRDAERLGAIAVLDKPLEISELPRVVELTIGSPLEILK